MFELKYECSIEIENIPIPWIPSIELFYPDLPQFPIMYIHTYIGNNRLIACPVCVNYQINETDCTAAFLVLTNIKVDERVENKIREELAERIGLANKVSKEDVMACCNSSTEYLEFFEKLWNFVEKSYGKYIPYGKFYEEVNSIVRFVSAWQPKTGKQSEMRMLYNFMSAFGESAKFPPKWEHLEFYVIPNLKDLEKESYGDFQQFSILVSAMKKLFHHYFTEKVDIKNKTFFVMKKAWEQNKDSFINNVTTPLAASGVLTVNEKTYAEKLVDAFNRHAWRAAYFISAFMRAKEYIYWEKDFFIEFYENGSALKGYSEKVIACFLQQGFGKSEIIPIDTWIETFYSFSLGIASKRNFYNTFSNLGKMERAIWLSSQANKTNMKNFFNLLWCQRYGVTGNSELRGINPIACYRCALKNTCVGLKNASSKSIFMKNDLSADKIRTLEEMTANEKNKNKEKRKAIKEATDKNKDVTKEEIKAIKEDIDKRRTVTKEKMRDALGEFVSTDYICLMTKGIPKKVYRLDKSSYKLIDEFSGYILADNDKIASDLIAKGVITMKEFVENKLL